MENYFVVSFLEGGVCSRNLTTLLHKGKRSLSKKKKKESKKEESKGDFKANDPVTFSVKKVTLEFNGTLHNINTITQGFSGRRLFQALPC